MPTTLKTNLKIALTLKSLTMMMALTVEIMSSSLTMTRNVLTLREILGENLVAALDIAVTGTELDSGGTGFTRTAGGKHLCSLIVMTGV